eukprot:g29939.t1
MGNALEGQGIKHVYASGAVYKGDFVNGQRHGRGVYTSKEGHRYEGQWLYDMRHGHGVQKFVTGGKDAKWTGTYVGHWSNNEKDGKGVFTYENGDKYEGDWRKGKKSGHGVYSFSNGDRYEGSFKNNNMHGKGTMLFADGSRLAGIWNDDELHGYAILAKPNGEEWQQVYQNGDVISMTQKQNGEADDCSTQKQSDFLSEETSVEEDSLDALVLYQYFMIGLHPASRVLCAGFFVLL